LKALVFYNQPIIKIFNKRKLKAWKILDSEWEWCKQFFDNKCAYCGASAGKLSKDHFENNGSNNIDNLIPACAFCNGCKGRKNFYNWFTENNPVYSKDRFNKIIQWISTDSKLL
jgi:HNH endonuclease